MMRSKRCMPSIGVTAFLLFANASQSEPPAGWILAGSNPDGYEVGTVSADLGGKAAYLKSRVTDPDGFGTLMQTFSAEPYLGSRLRLSGTVQAKDVEKWAGLWMRIDGANRGTPLGFDNMQSRPIEGTKELATYEVVLDIPQESRAIAFGILLVGSGEVLLDDVRFDEVDESVAVTSVPNTLSTTPSNLDFESN